MFGLRKVFDNSQQSGKPMLKMSSQIHSEKTDYHKGGRNLGLGNEWIISMSSHKFRYGTDRLVGARLVQD